MFISKSETVSSVMEVKDSEILKELLKHLGLEVSVQELVSPYDSHVFQLVSIKPKPRRTPRWLADFLYK